MNDNFVNVDNKFLMCKYQVTQKEYFEIMKDNPSNYQNENSPVECVNLLEAMEYCNKKSLLQGLDVVYKIYGANITIDKTKNGFRLPSPEEWIYAAKGGSLSKGFIYSGSNNPDEVAWYFGNSNKKTHSVGTKKPNELGIFDMSGNVWEWSDNLSGFLLGGAFDCFENDIKIDSFNDNNYDISIDSFGFRVVRSL